MTNQPSFMPQPGRNPDKIQPSLSDDVFHYLLEAGTERDQAFEIHPIVTDKAKIPTPMIREAFDVLTGALVHHEPGVCFIAESRYGKTFAIDVLRQTLPQSFPSVPTHSVVAKGHDRVSERTFYSDLLLDCGHSLSDSGTATARRIRLLNMWLATAEIMSSDRLVVFVDEAQNWTQGEFTFLRDVSNSLATRGVRLIVILFGHPGLLTTRASLIGSHS